MRSYDTADDKIGCSLPSFTLNTFPQCSPGPRIPYPRKGRRVDSDDRSRTQERLFSHFRFPFQDQDQAAT
jgi:hypothetical protein